MRTYAKFYLETKKEGQWEDVYINDPDFESAHKMIESQDYFKYAFLSGVRNYYEIKHPVVKKSKIFKRDEKQKNQIREEYGLNEIGYYPGYDDHIYEYYAEHDISISLAKQLQNGDNYLTDVYLIDDLLAFDYTKEIEYDINPESKYLNQRFLEKDETTYLHHLDYFVEALKVLKSFGVERILISYD